MPGGETAHLPATSPRQKCLCGEIPQNLWPRVFTHPSTEYAPRGDAPVTEAFLQHYNNERPHQGRACGNVPPRVAFLTLPTLPALPERIDPDAWLATLDQKMYLRHVGRDGCVNIDLTTYYVGPETGRADGPVASGSRKSPVCCVVPRSDRQTASH